MIVLKQASCLRLITQSDHARFAAQILSLWRPPELAEHPRRDELLLAVREHDNGWRESDSAPLVEPASGRPHTFLTIPGELRRKIWRRGTLRYAADRPRAALLITRHALEIHRDRRADATWESFFELLTKRHEELLETTGADPAEATADYRWLTLADDLSLAVCNGWREPLKGGDLSAHLQVDRLLLDPFPLAGATTLTIPCREIPNRRYDSDTDLAVELATARWKSVAITVAAGSGNEGTKE